MVMARPATTIHFLMTGGTIDSEYSGRQDRIVPNRKSIVPDYIRGLRLNQGLKFNVVCMKDSRDLDKVDRDMLVGAIETSPHRKIIVTHGLYTIADTGRYLIKNLKRRDQAIILVGSLLPIVGFAPSDAPFNLGFCLAEIRRLKRGCFVGMHGYLTDVTNEEELQKVATLSSPFTEKSGPSGITA